MSKFLIIPLINELDASVELAEKYNLGFEYDDFFTPNVLDDKARCEEIISRFKEKKQPEYCTLHGDFFDVLIFSEDAEIRRISALRIEQSMNAALQMNAKAVIFHTNHIPFLNSEQYIEKWLDSNEVFWRSLAAKYATLNIYLENMFDSSPDMLAELARRLSDVKNFGVCFDYAHAAISKTPLSVWVDALAPYVRHIHINDNDLASDSHLALGDGKIDWKEFVRAYQEKMSGATVLIETNVLDYQKRSIEYLSRLGVTELQSKI